MLLLLLQVMMELNEEQLVQLLGQFAVISKVVFLCSCFRDLYMIVMIDSVLLFLTPGAHTAIMNARAAHMKQRPASS